MAAAPSTRRSAEERRREIVEIAISHFAQHGYNGTSTDQVAREAGISQPYLFRLFGTKRELFLACHAAMHERIAETFAARRARRAGGGAHEGDGRRVHGPARRPHRAAVPDAELRGLRRPGDPDARARALRRRSCARSQEATGASPAELWSFFSHGMLLNVIAALNLDVLAVGEEWAACWVDPGAMLEEAPRPIGLMLDRLAAFIYRRRRRVLWGSLVVVLAAGFFGGPVFGLLDSSGDFDDPKSEAPLASRDVARATGASAAPDLVALVRLGAPADSAEAQRKLDRVAAALRDPGRRQRGALRARRQPRPRLEGRALVLRRGHASPPDPRRRARSRAAAAGAHPRRDASAATTSPATRSATRSPRTSRAPSCSRSRSSSCSRCSCSAASSRRCSRSRSAAPRSCSRSSRCGSSTARSSRCRSTR